MKFVTKYLFIYHKYQHLWLHVGQILWLLNNFVHINYMDQKLSAARDVYI